MNQPIFIVGCPSSGTTLLYSLLTSCPNISCGHETDFLVDFRAITEGKYWNKLKSYGFGKKYWHQKFAELFSSFKIDYAKNQGCQRWADKSPAYTPHLDFIYTLFPNCQIIHVIRDGRDVVMSHCNRWGYKSAIKAVYTWQKYITCARDFGKTLSDEQYMEIRYEDLVEKPKPTSISLFEYLREPWDEKVLQFDKSPNYSKSINYVKLVESRRQEDKDNSLIYRSRVGKGKNLDPFLKFIFHLWDEKLLKELGYL